MNNLNDIKKDLLSYIAHEQVAFQFGDGLINFTKPKDDYDSSDIELGLLDHVEQMKSYVSEAKIINVIDKDSLLDDRLGFASFASWSNELDTLFLVDDCLLICVPGSITALSLFNS